MKTNPIARPTCCGKPTKPVMKFYPPAWAQFFKCLVCGHNGVPFIGPVNTSYMDDMPRIREEGIAYDAWLESQHAL